MLTGLSRDQERPDAGGTEGGVQAHGASVAGHPHGSGVSVRRIEDERFVLGRGRYVDDLAPPGALFACFVRSPHAHARISAIDTSAARAHPGVTAIFTGADLVDAGVKGLPCGWLIHDRHGQPMAEPTRYPLTIDKVRHVGDPVAVVIASSLHAASDAAEAVAVKYEILPAVTAGTEATRPGAPLVWDGVESNLCCDWEIGDSAAVDQAFAGAAHVTRVELVNNRLVANPMEPRAVLGSFDAATGDYVLHTTSQNPHLVRSVLCNAVLGIPETRLRVISPDVGGGFGTKASLYPEETVLTWVAGRLGATIRWTASRSEGFQTDVQGRGHETVAELALGPDGTFLALRVKTHANVGAYLSTGSTAIPSYYYAPLLAGPYRTPAIFCNVAICFTNTTSVDAYRGAGRPEATYVLERLIDQAAWEMGIDRVALRRLNLIGADQFPFRTPLGLEYDSGDHQRTLAMALEAADWSGFPARQRAAAKRGKLRGIGVSTYVEVAGGTPSRVSGALGARGGRAEVAQIRVHPGGGVTVFSGAHSHGQGHETTFAQIVAERLNIPFSTVKVVQGDTERVPFGRGTIASRSLVVGGSAIIAGLDKIIAKGTKIAAHLLEANPSDIVFEGGSFHVRGTDHSVSFLRIANAAYQLHDFPIDELEPGLDETAFYDPKNWTFPGGCHICEVEIDPDTGTVHVAAMIAADDLGRIINPMIVEGQIHGGLAQGIGQALHESCVHDGSGQLLSGSFMDYQMPRAADLPSFTVLTHGTDCNHNPLKAKGCAEVGSVGSPPAIVNAIIDALRPVGVSSIDMPATAASIWRAIRDADRQGAAGGGTPSDRPSRQADRRNATTSRQEVHHADRS